VFEKQQPLSPIIKLLWNVSLFLSFGFFHTVLANSKVQQKLSALLPPQTMRAFYVMVTGVQLMWMIINWQHHDFYVWKLNIVNSTITQITGVVLYSMFFALFVIIIWAFDPAEFFGLKQIFWPTSAFRFRRTESTKELITTGFFGCMRHPIYFSFYCLFAIAPVMSFDRFFFVLAATLYLSMAIPIEEKKMYQNFWFSLRRL